MGVINTTIISIANYRPFLYRKSGIADACDRLFVKDV